MKRIAIFIMLLGALIVGASQIIAQTAQCGSLTDMTATLFQQYQEELIARGKGPGGQELLTFVRPDGLTWTVLVLLPDGRACMLASGSDWTELERTPAGSET